MTAILRLSMAILGSVQPVTVSCPYPHRQSRRRWLKGCSSETEAGTLLRWLLVLDWRLYSNIMYIYIYVDMFHIYYQCHLNGLRTKHNVEVEFQNHLWDLYRRHHPDISRSSSQCLLPMLAGDTSNRCCP